MELQQAESEQSPHKGPLALITIKLMRKELLETIQGSQVSLAEPKAANLLGLQIQLTGNAMDLAHKAQASDIAKLLTTKLLQTK